MKNIILSILALISLAGCGADPDRYLAVSRYQHPDGDGWVLWPTLEYDESREVFRMWYMAMRCKDGSTKLVYRESGDGVTWDGPGQIVASIKGVQTGIVRDASGGFHMGYWTSDRGVDVATSPDGMNWDFSPNIEFNSEESPDDIINPYFLSDGRLALFIKAMNGPRRITKLWMQESGGEYGVDHTVLSPSESEPSELEFYGLTPFLMDGKLVGAVRMLRDDIDRGVGDTTLATSEDGMHWNRSDEVLLSRGAPGSFDAAMAWVTSAVTVNGTTYLAYSGYDEGHKVGNRQIGIALIRGGK